jgi:glyceraldehyde-3-phosphate dehydrogenase/erythrose-4-phosphate dehydrogenase
MIKVGLIGAGKMGISHLSILGAHPDVEVVGVCDTTKMVNDFLSKYGKFNCFTDYEKMVEEVKPEAVGEENKRFCRKTILLKFHSWAGVGNNGRQTKCSKPGGLS